MPTWTVFHIACRNFEMFLRLAGTGFHQPVFAGKWIAWSCGVPKKESGVMGKNHEVNSTRLVKKYEKKGGKRR